MAKQEFRSLTTTTSIQPTKNDFKNQTPLHGNLQPQKVLFTSGIDGSKTDGSKFINALTKYNIDHHSNIQITLTPDELKNLKTKGTEINKGGYAIINETGNQLAVRELSEEEKLDVAKELEMREAATIERMLELQKKSEKRIQPLINELRETVQWSRVVFPGSILAIPLSIYMIRKHMGIILSKEDIYSLIGIGVLMFVGAIVGKWYLKDKISALIAEKNLLDPNIVTKYNKEIEVILEPKYSIRKTISFIFRPIIILIKKLKEVSSLRRQLKKAKKELERTKENLKIYLDKNKKEINELCSNTEDPNNESIKNVLNATKNEFNRPQTNNIKTVLNRINQINTILTKLKEMINPKDE